MGQKSPEETGFDTGSDGNGVISLPTRNLYVAASTAFNPDTDYVLSAFLEESSCIFLAPFFSAGVLVGDLAGSGR